MSIPSKVTKFQSLQSEFGKLPPQALDIEEAVLGALMIDKNALAAVIDILKPESFYKTEHQSIFKAIQILFNKSKPVDLLTVTEELRQEGQLDFAGGPFYVTDLTNRIASAANIEPHARVIAQKYIQRELIRISNEINKDAYEDTTDVFELLDNAEKKLFDISEGNLRRSSEGMASLIRKAIDQIESIKDRKDGLTGIPSGFTGLDRLTSGWQNSNLIIIASRPAMGKTAFALSAARNAAVDYKIPVAVFSLEMASLELVKRLISSETELPSEKLKNATLEPHEWQQLHTKIRGLDEAPLYIDDTPSLNIFELRAKCRRLKSQYGIKMIIVDYLQLMGIASDYKNKNREQEISQISRSLKSISKELDIPVIAISQLNRSVETRGGEKRPQLSDLRESGAIEQDADMVIFLYRPEYYNITEDENGNSLRGVAEIIVAKHRNGPTGNKYVRFIDKYPKFVDLENGEIDNKFNFTNLPATDNPPNTITLGSKMNDLENKADKGDENLSF